MGDRDRDRRGDGPHQFTGHGDPNHPDRQFNFQHQQQLPREVDAYRPQYNRAPDKEKRSRPPPTGPRRMPNTKQSKTKQSNTKQPWPKKQAVPAYDRPILSLNVREKTPELMAGMITGGEYLVAPDEGGDGENTAGPEYDANDEAEMEFSDGEDVKVGPVAPPDTANETDQFIEAEKKRMDVISMIRSFKTKALAEKPRNPVAENDDFIPLSFGDERKPKERFQDRDQDRGQDRDQEDGYKKRKKNDGTADVSPRSNFSHRDNHYSRYEGKRSPRDLGPPGTSDAPNFKLSPPPGLSGVKTTTAKPAKAPNNREPQGRDHGSNAASRRNTSPRSPKPVSKKLLDVPLGRKRKHSEITHKRTEVDGNIKDEFRARPSIDPVPWTKMGGDHSRCLNMGAWLHREITDFVSYIQPRAYEHAVRREMIHRIRGVVATLWRDADVRVFGSFAAEMYLPTSDIDLVVISSSFAQHGIPRYSQKASLWKLGTALKSSGIVKKGTLALIAGAKVPLVKFVDAETNLNVDISFENSSGLVANETFIRWKAEYPAMPMLVFVMKQFLAMRGLNEVYIGGLGSFSLTCMVVSMLQQLPSLSSGRLDGRLNSGVMLLEFLELYGKNFNTEKIGICVDSSRPGYFRKEAFPSLHSRGPVDPGLLCIQDPNKPDNDISRSSYLIKLVMSCWADAYDDIIDQMGKLDRCEFEDREHRSILGVIIGGNYQPIEAQRESMKEVYIRRIGQEEDIEMEERIVYGVDNPNPRDNPSPRDNPNPDNVIHTSNDKRSQKNRKRTKRNNRPHGNSQGDPGSRISVHGKGGANEPIIID